MKYTFRLTAKTSNYGLPKGSVVTVVRDNSCLPAGSEIVAAYKQQLGIDVRCSTCKDNFIVEELWKK